LRRAAGRAVLALAVAVSVLRLLVELRGIAPICCYDFPLFWHHVWSFASGGALYVPELASYGPGAGVYKQPPLFAVFILPATRLVSLEAALIGYLLVQVGLYLALVHALFGALAPSAGRGFGPLLLVLALNHGPLYETLLRLQLEVPIALALGLAVRSFVRRREAAAGAWLGVAAMLKLYPAALVAYPALAGRARAVGGFVAACLGIGLVGASVFGLEENGRFFVEIVPVMARELPTEDYGSENASLARYLMTLVGLPPAPARMAASFVSLLLMAVSLGLVVSRRRSGRSCQAGLELGLLVPVVLLAMPNAWTNYQLLLLIPLAAILATLTVSPRPLPLVLAVLASALMTYHKDVYTWQLGLPERWPVFTESLHGARPLATILTWIAGYWLLRRDTKTASAMPARLSAPPAAKAPGR
jgi:hypothetical protein